MLGHDGYSDLHESYAGQPYCFLLLVKAVHTVFVNLRMKKAFFANRVAMGEVTGQGCGKH